MFIEAMIIGLIIGVFINGRVSNLFDMVIKGWYLIIIGLIIQYIPLILNVFKVEYFDNNIFIILGNIVILIVLLINYEIKGTLIIAIGGVLNQVAYYFNGFKMPIIKSGISLQMIESINTGKIINYKMISSLSSWEKYLGKIIKFPEIYPFAKILSIGDIVIMIGLASLVALEMKKVYFNRKGMMLRFPYK